MTATESLTRPHWIPLFLSAGHTSRASGFSLATCRTTQQVCCRTQRRADFRVTPIGPVEIARSRQFLPKLTPFRGVACIRHGVCFPAIPGLPTASRAWAFSPRGDTLPCPGGCPAVRGRSASSFSRRGERGKRHTCLVLWIPGQSRPNAGLSIRFTIPPQQGFTTCSSVTANVS